MGAAMNGNDRADGEAGIPMRVGGNYHEYSMGAATLRASKAAEKDDADRTLRESRALIDELGKLGSNTPPYPFPETNGRRVTETSGNGSWLVWLAIGGAVLAFAWLAPIVSGWLEQRRIAETRLALYDTLSAARESEAVLAALGPPQPWYDPFGWGSTKPNAHGRLFDTLDDDELSGADAALLCQIDAAVDAAYSVSWDTALASQPLERRYDAIAGAFDTGLGQCFTASGVTAADLAGSPWPDNPVGLRERGILLSRLARKLPQL